MDKQCPLFIAMWKLCINTEKCECMCTPASLWFSKTLLYFLLQGLQTLLWDPIDLDQKPSSATCWVCDLNSSEPPFPHLPIGITGPLPLQKLGKRRHCSHWLSRHFLSLGLLDSCSAGLCNLTGKTAESLTFLNSLTREWDRLLVTVVSANLSIDYW